MSHHIYQKESILVSVDPWSAGDAVSAGVSPIYNIHQAHHLNRPAMSLHPGRARATRICVNLRHYRFLQCVPAPVFSACNRVRTSGQPAGVTTPKKLSPLEYGPQSRLIIFRVGVAGPINLHPVFSPSALRFISKFGVGPNVGFSRHIGSRGALFSPATITSGVLIVTRIKLVIPSCKDTAGRASRLIRRNSVAAAPRQSVSACGSTGPLFSHETRISP